MTTGNLKDQLASLLNLQSVDGEIYALRSEKNTLPAEIEKLRLEFETKKQGLAELEKSLLDVQKQKKDAELELASKEENAKKLKGQLYQLKTNNEYKAMLKQIDDAKADASLVEDKILSFFDKIDSVKKETENEKKKLQEEEKVFQEKKKKIDERIKEIEDRLSALDAKRKQIFPGIDPKILSQYERILKSRDGLAIVSVKDSSCKGCNMQVPPQVINMIRMYDRIITCGVCNRILYIDDNQ